MAYSKILELHFIKVIDRDKIVKPLKTYM